VADEWYYAQQGQQHGPVTAAQLKQLAQSGGLLPTDLVWKQGMANWAPASAARGLFPQAPAVNIAPGSGRTAAPAAPASSRNAAAAPAPVSGKARPGPVHVLPIDDDEDETYEEGPRSRQLRRTSQGLGTGAWIAIIGGTVGALVLVLVVIFLVVRLGHSARMGPDQFVETVPPGVQTYNITFKGGQAAHFSIAGQGVADVEIYVYDRQNRLVASNFMGISDRRQVTWLPPQTEVYRIDLKNNGPNPDRLTIVHN
jgi:hypothetical protein